jgi:hypothetical protein
MNARRWAGAALVALALTGCGASVREEAVARVAIDFGAAVATDDGASACALLGPSTVERLEEDASSGCAEAIVDEDLPDAGDLRGVDLYVGSARATFEHDTLFLAEFQGGWKVVAAGCRARPDRPYDCRLEGG